MRLALADLAELSGARVIEAPPALAPAEGWGVNQLTGRLVELSGAQFPAHLTAAFGLVVEAQLSGDRAAWVTLTPSSFFPPDVADAGVDLETLPVVRVPSVERAARAADYLVRSGGFGLVAIDLTSAGDDRATMPIPALTRLLGLARAHEAAVLILTKKSRDAASLNSLISLRAEAGSVRSTTNAAGYDVEIRVLKDKRGGAGRHHVEACRGSVGLR